MPRYVYVAVLGVVDLFALPTSFFTHALFENRARSYC